MILRSPEWSLVQDISPGDIYIYICLFIYIMFIMFIYLKCYYVYLFPEDISPGKDNLS